MLTEALVFLFVGLVAGLFAGWITGPLIDRRDYRGKR